MCLFVCGKHYVVHLSVHKEILGPPLFSYFYCWGGIIHSESLFSKLFIDFEFHWTFVKGYIQKKLAKNVKILKNFHCARVQKRSHYFLLFLRDEQRDEPIHKVENAVTFLTADFTWICSAKIDQGEISLFPVFVYPAPKNASFPEKWLQRCIDNSIISNLLTFVCPSLGLVLLFSYEPFAFLPPFSQWNVFTIVHEWKARGNLQKKLAIVKW